MNFTTRQKKITNLSVRGFLVDWTLNEASMNRQVESHLGALEIPHVDERLQNDDMQILSKLALVKRGLSEKAGGWLEFVSSSGQSRHLDGNT